MKNIEQLDQYLQHWQEVLNLKDWDLTIKLSEFTRTDYQQTGDIEVDKENKKATVLISKKDTGKDPNKVILHELIHLILWRYDQYSEKLIAVDNKNKYFELLEKTVESLTDIIYKNNH